MTKFQSQAEAIDDFQRQQGMVHVPRTLRASYVELERQFLTNEPYLQIAKRYGVSRQRIQQIYSKYFQPFMDSPKKRVNARLTVARAEKLDRVSREIPKLAALRSALESVGLTMEPIPTKHYRANSFTVKVGEHLCRAQVASHPMKTSPKCHRVYWRFNLTYDTISTHEFSIFVCGKDGEEDFFIVPTTLILDSHPFNPQGKRNRRTSSICIETQNLEPYNNQLSRIPYWNYHQAWSQLA